MRGLLVAVGLGVGANAWAVEITKSTVGDNTEWNTGYLGDKSQAFPMNSNGTWTFAFTNTNNGSAADYENFLLECSNGVFDEFVLRADNFEIVRWANTNITSTYAGSALATDLNGASVSMTVTRNGYHVAVSATITPTTEATAFSYKYDFYNASGNLNLYLSVDHSHLDITSAEWAASTGTITETQVTNCNFENGETLFTNVSNTTISNVNNATLNSNVVSLTYSGNNFGSSSYIYSTYDFSSNINAQVVRTKIEFDCYLTSGSPNYDILFSLCDKSLRNGESRSQSDDGVIFNIGERRSRISGTNTDYFSINNAVTSTTVNDGLNKWIHVEVNVDNENKKVSYIVRNQDHSSVLYKGYDVAFLDPNATTCNMIDYHAVLKIASYMDNLVITKYVDNSKVNYTLKAVDSSSNELATLSSGWTTSGTAIYYNKYINVNGKYYVTANRPYKKVITTADNTVVYSPSLITQFVEATSSNWGTTAYTGDADYYSNGDGFRGASSAKTLLTVAETGIYSLIFTVCSQNTGTGKEITLSVYKNSAEDANKLHADYSINHSYKYIESTGLITIENLSLSEGDKIILAPNKTSCVLDYIALAKTGEPATVGANGYATFASPYALDLTDANRPEGLKAYKATLNGSTLTFTKLNQTVPAGTGLLLLGETKGGTYNIPVVANGDAVTNALVGVTSDTPLQSTEGGTYYFVMKKATTAEDALAFAPLSTASAVTIPAGKAYVELDTSAGARSLTVAFDDETTGINSVNGEGIKVNGFYNLNGQRVENPTKGLYIMNGKKVILK